ncbi:MAG: hypothetical protein CMM47_01030 [Rhodospirillaceae bacterium]|nr:hypothetical protein [Rhodospirillaceae bacterium]
MGFGTIKDTKGDRKFLVYFSGVEPLQRLFKGMPKKLKEKYLKRGVQEVKKSMVKQTRAILAPHKRTGTLARSLGHRTTNPRYPRVNPATGDVVTMMRPRLGFDTVYGTSWDGKPLIAKPGLYSWLADRGTYRSRPINYNRKVLSRHRSKATKVLTTKVKQAIAQAKAKGTP